MVLFELFWSFMKIGFTSFGGMSMVPLINSEMVSHGWMGASEVSDIVAIAEMTPGPLGLNCATFAGIKAAGVFGALAANFGVLMPTFTLCLLAAVFFEKFKASRIMQNLLVGIRPACFGLIVGVVISLSVSNYAAGGAVSIPSVLIGLLDLVLMVKFQWSVPKVIGISAVLGLVLFGLLGL